MSRHRFVRNLDANDFKEDFDDYSSSFEENYSVSPGAAQYLIRRGSFSGDDPLERRPSEEGELSPPSAPTFSEYIDMYKIDYETEVRLRIGVEEVIDAIGDSFEEAEIADALLYYNFDLEKTVAWMLEGRTSTESQRQSQPSAQPKAQPPKGVAPQAQKKTEPAKSQPSKSKAGENKGGVTIFGFDTPSPDDVVTNARLKKDSAPASSPSSPFAKTPVSKPQASHPADSPRSQLSAGLNPSKGSASVPSTPTERDPGTPKGKRPEEISKTLPKNVKITKMKVNIQEEFAERKKGKETLNLVVVGHVDAGKSTLMGHLLYLLGEVSQKIMNKHERESQKIGKSSFAFAWALDETEEERKRGITMDIATRKFETENRRVTLLDAPGHRDFIPNMISGAAQADVSILVVDATTGEFEAGFEADGQTKEHSLLIRSLGVSQVVVAINKLDNMKWSKERYDEIIGKLLPFLKQSGFKDKNVTFVPCSGLTGENLVKREAPELCVWYTGPTLIQSIDAFQPPERSIDKPLRISVSDIFKSANAGGISVSGRIEAGYISKDDQILIMPGNTVVTVKSIEIHDQPTKLAVAGENVVLNLAGLEREQIGNSSILCEASAPIRVVSSFVAQILVFDVKIPVTKGDTVVLHFLSMNEQSTITKLVGILDKSSGEIKQKNPRFLPKNSTAVVEIKMGKPICMETYKDLKELGRFTLRSAGKTIAAGVVQEIRE